ncbi:hypothetical protein [Rhodopila sp.]|uniref:hypothetical protein n=1 Tax=Rhodopila sp. TaxID=2480087 RepID=UPI003D141ADF
MQVRIDASMGFHAAPGSLRDQRLGGMEASEVRHATCRIIKLYRQHGISFIEPAMAG